MRRLLEVPVDLHTQGAARERMVAVATKADRAPARVDVDDPAAGVRAIERARTEHVPRVVLA
jgi:hypothetical protein